MIDKGAHGAVGGSAGSVARCFIGVGVGAALDTWRWAATVVAATWRAYTRRSLEECDPIVWASVRERRAEATLRGRCEYAVSVGGLGGNGASPLPLARCAGCYRWQWWDPTVATSCMTSTVELWQWLFRSVGGSGCLARARRAFASPVGVAFVSPLAVSRRRIPVANGRGGCA